MATGPIHVTFRLPSQKGFALRGPLTDDRRRQVEALGVDRSRVPPMPKPSPENAKTGDERIRIGRDLKNDTAVDVFKRLLAKANR